MSQEKKTKVFLFFLSSTIFLLSCGDWLSVQPSNAVTEEKLFSTREGFFQALNGIYLELNSPSLYGETLLCSDIEIMAGVYAVSGNNADYLDMAGYKYSRQYPKRVFQAVWDKAYELILGINNILAKAEGKKDVLGEYYDLYTGELYALRAFLHFDILRLFGPLMLAGTANDNSIPYKMGNTVKTDPLLPVTEVFLHLVKDLETAEKAVAKDPVITQGPHADNKRHGFFQNRNLRMNYYAVKGLQARVYLYAASCMPEYRQKAFESAYEIIRENDAKEWFPFVLPAEVLGSSPDRVFTSEILFMLQNNKRGDIFKKFFQPSISMKHILAPSNEFLADLYVDTDYRYRPLWLASNEKNFRCLYKYAFVENGKSNDMVPMIRLSEIYLIAAETAPDKLQAMKILNEFVLNRYSRQVSRVEELEEAIEKEYRREFFAEGQLFFYYKRKNKKLIPGIQMTMEPEFYVVPLPESEVKYR